MPHYEPVNTHFITLISTHSLSLFKEKAGTSYKLSNSSSIDLNAISTLVKEIST